MKDRINFLIGAGAPLDLELPKRCLKPTTANITQEVIKPYKYPLGGKIDVVKQIYNRLAKNLPADNSNWTQKPKPVDVNFEHLFHVLETFYAYGPAWAGQCSNPLIFPILAPLLAPTLIYDYQKIHWVLDEFITRVMNVIEQYNDVVLKGTRPANQWYHDFYKAFDRKADFFVLNYDYTIEKILGNYVDGFVDDGVQSVFKVFDPQELLGYQGDLSTVNHLHGAINYYESTYHDPNQDVYTALPHDMCKYPDYATVKALRAGRGGSGGVYQTKEQYYPAPIITGLRKLDKLNSFPFDFYHAHMVNRVTDSRKLVIIGYSFGDDYCNQLIERMHALHGNHRRIVLIDFWDIPVYCHRYNGGLYLSHALGRFLSRCTHVGNYDEVVRELYQNEVHATGLLYSTNGCLMVCPKGFKHAAQHLAEIQKFLNS